MFNFLLLVGLRLKGFSSNKFNVDALFKHSTGVILVKHSFVPTVKSKTSYC